MTSGEKALPTSLWKRNGASLIHNSKIFAKNSPVRLLTLIFTACLLPRCSANSLSIRCSASPTSPSGEVRLRFFNSVSYKVTLENAASASGSLSVQGPAAWIGVMPDFL